MRKIIYLLTFSSLFMAQPAAADLSPFEGAVMAGTGFFARDLWGRIEAVNQKIFLLNKIMQRTGRDVTDKLLSSEHAQAIAKDLERSKLLREISEHEETPESLKKKKWLLQALLVADVMLGLGILAKNIIPWGKKEPEEEDVIHVEEPTIDDQNPLLPDQPEVTHKSPVHPPQPDPITGMVMPLTPPDSPPIQFDVVLDFGDGEEYKPYDDNK